MYQQFSVFYLLFAATNFCTYIQTESSKLVYDILISSFGYSTQPLCTLPLITLSWLCSSATTMCVHLLWCKSDMNSISCFCLPINLLFKMLYNYINRYNIVICWSRWLLQKGGFMLKCLGFRIKDHVSLILISLHYQRLSLSLTNFMCIRI